MAEIIDFIEISRARRRSRAALADRDSLERAAVIMRRSLAAYAAMLADAPPHDQHELLTRVERLAAMIRYAMRMMGDGEDPGLDSYAPPRGGSR